MAISRDPELGEIYYARAICYQKMGKKDLAQADVQKAKSLGFNRQ
jgi:Tfp pilus assembly protein PilF